MYIFTYIYIYVCKYYLNTNTYILQINIHIHVYTAEPGSPTIFAPISFSAWNSAHHRPRKVTPKSFPIVNAARIYHFDNMTSIGMWFPHCERKSHHSKKHVFGGLNWGTVKCFSHCQRDVKSYPFASISVMVFYMWHVPFPLSTRC